MKKIIVVLLACGSLSACYAAPDSRYDERHQNYQSRDYPGHNYR